MTSTRPGMRFQRLLGSKAKMIRSSLQASCTLAVASLFSMHGTAFAQLQTIPSLPLSTFQDSLGVNVHMNYTDGKYADANAVLSDLKLIGIHNLRNDVPNPITWLPSGQGLDALHLLAANGMRFNFVGDCNADFNTQMQQMDQFVQAYPGSIASVEGQNEINNFPCKGGDNEQLAEAFQRRLYANVHSDPTLTNVPVLYMTGAAPVNLQSQSGFADVANTHPYPYGGVQPYARLQSDFNSYFTMKGSYARTITETGYATLPYANDPDGVDEPAQAELILNEYFDAALQGVTRTYVYQLLDPYPDPQHQNSDSNFGFFHLDGSPKILAWAMHHIAEVFPADKSSAPQTVQAAITGLPSTAHVLALTGSDGSVAMFMWNEASVWNKDSQTLQIVNNIPVKVQMDGSWNVSYFTPAEDTTTSVAQQNGKYTSYLSTYPTALIFKKQ